MTVLPELIIFPFPIFTLEEIHEFIWIAFKKLVEVTKPGGLIVIGLYHKYGRFFTRVKQKAAKLLGKKWI